MKGTNNEKKAFSSGSGRGPHLLDDGLQKEEGQRYTRSIGIGLFGEGIFPACRKSSCDRARWFGGNEQSSGFPGT